MTADQAIGVLAGIVGDEDDPGDGREALDAVRKALADRRRLAGSAEFCELLGIPHSQRGNLHRLPGLPKPQDTLRVGKVWSRADAVRFAREFKRKREAAGNG